MAYQIKRLDSKQLQAGRLYLFDTNLWLKILKPRIGLSSRDVRYLQFFEDFAKNEVNPKIALTSLILSEIINRYIRDVSYRKFCQQQKNPQPDPSYYKLVYRISKQYQTDYQSLVDDIKAYEHCYVLVSDGVGTEISPDLILSGDITSRDFNDNIFYHLARSRGYIIVTDDQDFFLEDVEVQTFNQQLQDKAKSAVIIKR